MRYILALSMLLMAGTAFGSIIVPRTELKAEDFERLGIVLTAVDSNSPSSRFFPVVVTLNLDAFNACSVTDVYLGFMDEYGILMAGTSVAPRHGGYAFQVRREFFGASRLTLLCSGMTEYVINVGTEVPVVSVFDR